MCRRRRFRALLPLALLLVGGSYALASWNRCDPWGTAPPILEAREEVRGRIRAGAGRVALAPPWPVVLAGYSPLRMEASGASEPLHARALVLEVGALRIGLVSLDLLMLPDSLASAIREEVQALGFDHLAVLATHAHSSVGAYDDRGLFEAVGTGRFRVEVREALVRAAAGALRAAVGGLGPAEMERAELSLPRRVISRSDGVKPDPRLTWLGWRRPDGALAAELIIFAAHPTLMPRKRGALADPDWPGRLAAAREAAGGVALVVQGPGGNASAVTTGKVKEERATAFAEELASELSRAPRSPVESDALAFARVRMRLPRPDSSRLAPFFARAAGDNLLCDVAPREAEVAVLKLGGVSLLLIPGEPTSAAARVLEQASGADRTLGLAGGYLGYVEPSEVVKARAGESKRQYYGPTLLECLVEASVLATGGSGAERARGRKGLDEAPLP